LVASFDVIYLTGAPAAGKSSTARALKERVQALEVWEFGDRLKQHLARRFSSVSQEDLRRESEHLITPEDVAAVDRWLIEWAHDARKTSHVVIDSHPVTKERYGFRVTPYSLADFARLAPTKIWALYCSPEVTLQRIGRNPAGRPSVTPEEARMHTLLQASVAVTYGMSLGIPVHFFDSDGDPARLADELAARLQ
jgi:adenylate kinase